MPEGLRPVLVCYISGLDLRRIRPETMPFLAAQRDTSPWVAYRNIPSNELFPTLMTGVDPTAHGVWGVRIHPRIEEQLALRPIDRVPDLITTTAQCIAHFLTGACDLSAIPPKRRRRFEITRTKYRRRRKRPDALNHYGDIPTLLEIVGTEQSEYFFCSSAKPANVLLGHLFKHRNILEIVELYTLDRYQQWHLDDEDATNRMYRVIDDFLMQLKDRCREFERSLIILSDHGHQKITKSNDIFSLLDSLDIPDSEYTCFIEVSSARFWFHSDRARKQIPKALEALAGIELTPWQKMAVYGIPVSDGAYGELFGHLDPGHIFFPHDFYQPLANLFFGLTDRLQRSRLKDPRHRGNHGHLPHFDAEKSMLLVSDPGFVITGSGPFNILDIAPSLLEIIGAPVPIHLPGQAIFGSAK